MKSGHRVEARAQGDGWVTLTGDFIKPEQVESTEGRHFGRGALEGLGIGAAAGGTSGVIFIAIAAREDGLLYLALPAFAVLGSAAGGLTGAVIGSVIGSNDVQRRVAPRLQVVPTSSGARAQLSWNF